MDVRRPLPGSLWRARLAVRLHPRHLRRRLPLALAAAVAVVALPALGARSAAPPGAQALALVAAADLDPGRVLGPGDVRSVPVPVGLLPADAVTEVPDGAVVRSAIGVGEIVTGRRLAGEGVPGSLAAQERAVALPWPPARPPLAVGDTVDLVASRADERTAAVVTRVVATGSVVVAVGEDGFTVSLPVGLVPVVHEALAVGAVDVAITPFRR